MKNKKWNRIIILMLGISIVLNGYLFIESQNKTTTIVQLNKKNKELNKYSQLFKNGTDIKFVDIKESDGQISMAYLYQDKQLIEKHGTNLSTETLIHSDQGSHYTSIKFIQLLKDNELRQSMSRRANCWDNAPQESFFGHMKDELDLSECYSYEEILNAVRDWTEYYNTERYQWDLARFSPVEYYQYMTTGIYPLIIPKAKGENNQSEASL